MYAATCVRRESSVWARVVFGLSAVHRVRWRSWENVITEVVHSLQTNNQPYHFSVYGCSADDARAQTRERGPTDVLAEAKQSLRSPSESQPAAGVGNDQ